MGNLDKQILEERICSSKKSAGILLYRFNPEFEVFLAHPGGPYFANKDIGAWSIPKGEFTDETALDAALREFEEETGFKISGQFYQLRPVKTKSGKIIYGFAIEGDIDASKVKSNTCKVEFPYNSGCFIEIPEIDRGEWFSAPVAMQKINVAQAEMIKEILEFINASK